MVPGVPGDLADANRLADEQAALRRVAELVAAGASEPIVFEAVTEEACRLLGGHFTALLRFEPDGPPVIVAMSGDGSVRHVMHVGMRISVDGDGVVQRVRRTARAARIEHYELVPGPNASIAHELGLSSGVGAPILIEGHVWGAITVLGSDPLHESAEDRLRGFAELAATAISSAQARTNLAVLVREQAALLRVAELVARGVPQESLFEAVAAEASQLLDEQPMTLTRFDADRELVVVAARGGPAPAGTRIRFDAETLPDFVRREDRAVRVDDYTRERDAQLASRFGLAAAVAAPISVQGRVWGMLTATSGSGPLPAGTEQRLEQFAKLVASALANVQARAELQALADEQAALRRVAELVAHGAALDEVFGAVAAEASKQLGGLATALVHHEPDDVTVVVARCDGASPPGVQIGAGIAAPVVVEGRVWGSLTTAAPVPDGTEDRLQPFAELAAAAIANAENKANLTASRARVVATADETRRRLQRDLHDGAQQRLVHAQITLELAKDAAADGRPTASLIDAALAHTERANRELGDLVHGILPAALTIGGLLTGIESLTDDIRLPIELRVSAPRLPAQTETTAYFIVAEALTNVVKHAGATRASVEIALRGSELSIEIRDDGAGGADAGHGTGLTGLLDRVEAADGTLTISSAPGNGTALHARLPVSGASRP
jgi:signal transduction histidine kinase